MMLVDTHSHIYLPEFDADRASMLERAGSSGIGKILMPAIDSSTHSSMIRLAQQNDLCISMMGLHPCSVKDNYREELAIAKKYLDKEKFIAVGEIGLDFYWDLTHTKQQHEAFHEQIEWALDLELPIVIHSRNSIDECIQVVSEHQQGKLRGVFHCFSGNEGQARQIMELGFYLGIGGVLTFKNSGLDKVMEQIGLEKIILETDAPYLAPVPFRGKRNEPSYIKYVVEKLSLIKNISQEDIGVITTRNANDLFPV